MSRPTTFCERCGEYVGWRWVMTPDRTARYRQIQHIDADGLHLDRGHTACLDQRGLRNGYVRQPRVGDVIESGRWGYITVGVVREHGLELVTYSAHGRQVVRRADNGVWWRVAKAER